jgi:triacylglycerol lipase
MSAVSHVFLSPGLFGFKMLGSYDYFCHVEAGLRRRFRERGREASVHVVDVHPTSSIRRRASKLVAAIEEHGGSEGALHLVGHSTGGLDARLAASPTVNLGGQTGSPRWKRRLRSVTTMNTPHYGTPLASFFATVSGQRVLFALSALTVAALKLGAPPLALTSSLVAAFGRLDHAFGVELRVIDRLTEGLVRVLDDAASADLRKYLSHLRDDQGAIIQLSPESMDLFQAGVEDNPDVYYQCTASYAPAPGMGHWARVLRSPLGSLSAPIFATLYRLTGLENAVYPCEPPVGGADPSLLAALGHLPPRNASDGVVPVRSQVWGDVAWAGLGDHLDVMGHFAAPAAHPPHIDWLCSGAGFDERRFAAMLDAIVDGMLRVEAALPAGSGWRSVVHRR